MILLNGQEVKFSTFPNGETRMITEGLNALLESNSKISFKYENDSDLIKLMFLKRYLDGKVLNTIMLFIYYMPYSRMDRTENGSAFTLKYVADFINQLSFTKVSIIEPHSDVTPALVNNSRSNYINYGLLPKVMEEVSFHPAYDYIVFPDQGASKRYSNIVAPNQLVGHKKRDFETGRITSLDLVGEIPSTLPLQNAKAVIVDDLSSYGGTFILTAKALREKGFKEVYLLVAHAEDSIFKGDLFKSGLIDKVFTTNTILDNDWNTNWYNALHFEQLKVYNIEELLSND